MRAAGLGDVATYGEALVRHVVDHLLHICGEFGFAGARLPEGLGVILRDDEALHATLLRVFDADADGVVTASDLATTLEVSSATEARPRWGGASSLRLSDNPFRI